jgi:Domain of unknown function (DUF4333)
MFEGATIVRGSAFALAALAAALVIGGCGGLDADKAEQNIKKGIEAQGRPVKSVSCPSDIKKKEGETFQCTAVTGDGQQVAVKVTETDNNGGIAWQTIGATGQQTAATTGPSGPSGPSNPAASGATTKGPQPAPTAGKEPLVLRFKTFRNPSAGYSIDYPGHWKQRGTGKDVTFAFVLRFMHLVSFKGRPQTPATVQKAVTQDKRTVTFDTPKTVRIPAGRAIRINFTIKSGASRQRIRRYTLSAGGKVFSIDFGFGQNKNFDAAFNRVMKRVLRTFRIL